MGKWIFSLKRAARLPNLFAHSTTKPGKNE
jgi:hypothetical protein